MKYALLGSISHGTLRTEDLLDVFANELEYHVLRNAADLPLAARETLRALVYDAREVEDYDSEAASEIVNELQDALQEFAPPYCYFGNTEGDGSDFGFWPDMYGIEDLPRVDSSIEARELGEDCISVNDHGNVTVYGGDGSILLELV